MTNPKTSPYGSWPSPISAARAAAGSVRLGQLQVVEGDLYWTETRPLEGGRTVLVRHGHGNLYQDFTPPGFSVRTRVHEYGGGAFFVHGDTVFFSNFKDQRLYRQESGRYPVPITANPNLPAGLRYADPALTADGQRLVCIREQHDPAGTVVNEIVCLRTDGSSEPIVLASGRDFFASPRISPDGLRLAWLAWDHPQMPWDGTELWCADLRSDGSVGAGRLVAGGRSESIFQPEWSRDGSLHFVSDRSGWWNLYRVQANAVRPILPMAAEFGFPQWIFGLSRYAFLDNGLVGCIYDQEGISHLGILDPVEGSLHRIDLGYTAFEPPCLRSDGERLFFAASSPEVPASIISCDPAKRTSQVVHSTLVDPPDPAFISIPEAMSYETRDGVSGHALFYPPKNRDYAGPSAELPPLIVISHGGPTSASTAGFELGIQYWTSRGFALVDVNYGGSTGYGRAYRQRLNGRWGVVDVDDCIAAAEHLAHAGRVDPRRMIIRGGSAGGFTTLCALVFHDVFAAGASYYGVADLELLARETHKFESRYLDGLVGPYPQAREEYVRRSPIHAAERLSCPVILFQGKEDQVVPPSQSSRLVEALRSKHLPFAYLEFEGEQHGFRRAETVQRCYDAELYFYSRVLGFPLSEPIEPLDIENL